MHVRMVHMSVSIWICDDDDDMVYMTCLNLVWHGSMSFMHKIKGK